MTDKEVLKQAIKRLEENIKAKEEVLKKLERKRLPYLEVLLKSWEAHISYLRLMLSRSPLTHYALDSAIPP